MQSADNSENLAMDASQLYREETFTDRRVGTIQRLTPVDKDGAVDNLRPVLYVGHSQILTPVGALPLNFEIEASSLADATDKFADGAARAAEQAFEEIKEMRRQSASSIVVPEPGASIPGAGGGKIQFP